MLTTSSSCQGGELLPMGCCQLCESAHVCSFSACWLQPGSAAWRSRLRQLALRAFLRVYTLLHMLSEGLSFSYQLAYLLQASPYFSPSLHLLGQHVVRASGQQLVRHLPALARPCWMFSNSCLCPQLAEIPCYLHAVHQLCLASVGISREPCISAQTRHLDCM